ncbi:hypothetical protein H8959_005457 [Pygathrix nigripes]
MADCWSPQWKCKPLGLSHLPFPSTEEPFQAFRTLHEFAYRPCAEAVHSSFTMCAAELVMNFNSRAITESLSTFITHRVQVMSVCLFIGNLNLVHLAEMLSFRFLHYKGRKDLDDEDSNPKRREFRDLVLYFQLYNLEGIRKLPSQNIQHPERDSLLPKNLLSNSVLNISIFQCVPLGTHLPMTVFQDSALEVIFPFD